MRKHQIGWLWFYYHHSCITRTLKFKIQRQQSFTPSEKSKPRKINFLMLIKMLNPDLRVGIALLVILAAPWEVWANEQPLLTPAATVEILQNDDSGSTALEMETMTPPFASPLQTPSRGVIFTVLATPTPLATFNASSTPKQTISYTATPVITATRTMTVTATSSPKPTDGFHFDLSSKIEQADVTVIPNPAWGAKLSFRVILPALSLVRIRIYDHNLEAFGKIEKVGDKVFDILWSLKDVPEGLYYYQVQVVDQETGKITKLPLNNFAVMK